MSKRDPHLLISGKPKRAYKTQEEAAYAALVLQSRDGRQMDVYVCPTGCEGRYWHVGRQRTKIPISKINVDPAVMIEMDRRVIGCLLLENYGPENKRLGVIGARTNAVRRRRNRGDWEPVYAPRRTHRGGRLQVWP